MVEHSSSGVTKLTDRLAALGYPDPLDTLAQIVADLPVRIARYEAEGNLKEAREARKLLARCEGQLRRYGR